MPHRGSLVASVGDHVCGARRYTRALLRHGTHHVLRGRVGDPLRGLQGEVIDVGTASVLPAMLVVYPGQVPGPWEQLLHGALGNVAR